MRIEIDDELVDQIARRAAQLLAQKPPGASSEPDGWLRGAAKIAEYIDCPRSRVYGLVAAHQIPIHRDGSALIARRSDLDAWLKAGGGMRR